METYSLLKKSWLLFLPLISIRVSAELPPAYLDIAKASQVPAELLYAVSLNEAGKKLASKNVKPWPWTLNVKGKSYFYPTRKEACFALQNFVKKYPLKNIDVGIAQVNIGYNGHKYFADHCDGFEPSENLRVASILLANCYKVHKNWINAAGCYHRPAGGSPAKRYKAGIRAKLALIQKNVTNNKFAPVSVMQKNEVIQSEHMRQTQVVKMQPKYIEPLPIHGIEKDTRTIELTDNLLWVAPDDVRIIWVEPK